MERQQLLTKQPPTPETIPAMENNTYYKNHHIPTTNNTNHGETTNITKTITFPPQTILISLCG
jgi:hypothetical protein